MISLSQVLCPFCQQAPILTGIATRAPNNQSRLSHYTCHCQNKQQTFSGYVTPNEQNEEQLIEFYLYQPPFRISCTTTIGWEIKLLSKHLYTKILEEGEEELSIQQAYRILQRFQKLTVFS